jgi:hypothetical protein
MKKIKFKDVKKEEKRDLFCRGVDTQLIADSRNVADKLGLKSLGALINYLLKSFLDTYKEKKCN